MRGPELCSDCVSTTDKSYLHFVSLQHDRLWVVSPRVHLSYAAILARLLRWYRIWLNLRVWDNRWRIKNTSTWQFQSKLQLVLGRVATDWNADIHFARKNVELPVYFFKPRVRLYRDYWPLRFSWQHWCDPTSQPSCLLLHRISCSFQNDTFWGLAAWMCLHLRLW